MQPLNTETTNPETLTVEQIEAALVSVKAAAAELGLSLSAISHHVKVKNLAAARVGTATLILRSSLEAFKVSHAAQAKQTAEERELRAKLKELVAQRNGQKAPTVKAKKPATKKAAK